MSQLFLISSDIFQSYHVVQMLYSTFKLYGTLLNFNIQICRQTHVLPVDGKQVVGGVTKRKKTEGSGEGR